MTAGRARASATTRGSTVIIPSTSVQIWISSAPSAAPSSDADQSDPPRPSVVVAPSRVAPMKPAEDRHHPGFEDGAHVRDGRRRRLLEQRARAPERLVGDDHAPGIHLAGGQAGGAEGGGHDLVGQALAHARDRVHRSRGQLAEVVDAAVQGAQLGEQVVDLGQEVVALRARRHQRVDGVAMALQGRRQHARAGGVAGQREMGAVDAARR